jgi:hypothetical protein
VGDPHGRLYLVDHTGTHPVGRPPTHDPEIEVWPTGTVIHADPYPWSRNASVAWANSGDAKMS